MIIDSHVHLKHGDAAKTEYSPEAIVEVMDAAGIDRSVVFAMSTTTRRSIEMAEEAARKFRDRLIPYVYALPSYDRVVVEELEQAIGQLRFRGIKIHIGECRLTDYIVDPVLELATEYGVPCLVDFGGDLASAERIARDFPATKLIVAHFGRYLCTDAEFLDRVIQMAGTYENVWLDSSGVTMEGKIEQAVGAIGAERIVFGTDGPHPKPDLLTFARAPIEQISALDLTDEQKALILGGSIAALLGL
jgi:predicted TIM-barrel fold metal-dependent hydrolase